FVVILEASVGEAEGSGGGPTPWNKLLQVNEGFNTVVNHSAHNLDSSANRLVHTLEVIQWNLFNLG
ncbi:MAG TPA: hypothetical protein VLH15_02495, partial [Dehalococcoidales bacterium]|nr:hypothetical protein [Dehalococcoidales bacterium]